MNSTRSKKIEKLSDREFRGAYVASQISVGVPFQIRALRKQRGWPQGKLAEEAGMMQPRISAIEKAGRGKLNIDTLERIAAAFDVGLMVKFVPFSELVGWEENFDPDTFAVSSFSNDTNLYSQPETAPGVAFLEEILEATASSAAPARTKSIGAAYATVRAQGNTEDRPLVNALFPPRQQVIPIEPQDAAIKQMGAANANGQERQQTLYFGGSADKKTAA